jgi:hypothetical protein
MKPAKDLYPIHLSTLGYRLLKTPYSTADELRDILQCYQSSFDKHPKRFDLNDNRPARNLIKVYMRFKDKNCPWAQRFKAGIYGEKATAKILESLREDCHAYVLHSITYSDHGDIDHILICNRGVMIIDSKNSTHRIVAQDDIRKCTSKVNKYLKSMTLHQGVFELNMRASLINFPIACVFSVLGPLTVIKQSDYGQFIPISSLKESILNMPVVIDDDSVDSIFNIIRLSIFWGLGSRPEEILRRWREIRKSEESSNDTEND